MSNQTKQTHEEFLKRFSELMKSFDAEIWANGENQLDVFFKTPGINDLIDVDFELYGEKG